MIFMAIKPQLNISQSQHLTLTPQLMQAIKLLQLGHIELSAFVENELLQNPLLERDEGNNQEAESSSDNKEINNVVEENYASNDLISSASEIASGLDTDVENVFPEQVGQDSISQSTNLSSSNPLNNNSSESAPDIDSYVAAKPKLSDHLWQQIALLLDNPAERMIGQFLIESLDEAGYLNADIPAMAQQLGTSEEHILSVLKKVQACDPSGVFCRDLSECMAIQLAAIDRLDPMMQGLLNNLKLVMEHDFENLAKTINASKEDISDMLSELRELNPKPAQSFETNIVQTIVADVFVKQANDKTWVVELNSDILPRVLVNRTYFAKVKQKIRAKSEKTYLVDCLQSANWLTKSLDQRAKTILKVATQIISFQDSFLTHGITQLKPMTLKMVADEIEMHESTVSRVSANKYISTPRGMFEMKYFFTTALSSTTGNDSHSSESVRYLIKQMVDEEDLNAILSDATISKILKNQHGIDVARRTVMKYREGMHIASSVVRRRQKKQNIL